MKIKSNTILTIASVILWLICLIPSVSMIMFSPMLFDAPGSEKFFINNALFYLIITFPVLILVSIIGSIITLLMKKNRANIIFSMLPLLSIVLGIFVVIASVIAGK